MGDPPVESTKEKKEKTEEERYWEECKKVKARGRKTLEEVETTGKVRRQIIYPTDE